MIIFNRASGTPRVGRALLAPSDDRTSAPIRRPQQNGTAEPGAIAASRGGDPELAAQAQVLKAKGAAALARAEADPGLNLSGNMAAVQRELSSDVELFLANRPNAAAAANAERRLRPILVDILTRTDVPRETARKVELVQNAGESTIAALKLGVDDAADLVRGQFELIGNVDLDEASRRDFRIAMVARLEREALGHLLGAEFDDAKAEAARRFPREVQSQNRGTGGPVLVPASTRDSPGDIADRDGGTQTIRRNVVGQTDPTPPVPVLRAVDPPQAEDDGGAGSIEPRVARIQEIVNELGRTDPDGGIERFGNIFDEASPGSVLRRGIDDLIIMT